MADVKQFVLLILLLMAMMLVFVNRIISVRISRPIMKLDHSVREYQEGKEEKIAIGGSTEIRHLGQSIQESYRQNSELMKKVIWEQNERRKSEFDVLQSQINPHFLYNTLDSITWMIESGKNEEAAFMITQLAKLFRISLSKGHTVIRIRDELQHAQSYVNIQKVRYKNKFEVVFDIRPDILDDCIVKLVLGLLSLKMRSPQTALRTNGKMWQYNKAKNRGGIPDMNGYKAYAQVLDWGGHVTKMWFVRMPDTVSALDPADFTVHVQKTRPRNGDGRDDPQELFFQDDAPGGRRTGHPGGLSLRRRGERGGCR